MNAQEIVSELNSRCFDLMQGNSQSIAPFQFRSDGATEAIVFLDYVIWDSDNDGMDYEEDGNTEIPLIKTVERLFRDFYRCFEFMKPDDLFNKEASHE